MRLKQQTEFTDWTLGILKPIQPKIQNTQESIQVGIKLNKNLSGHVKKMVNLEGRIKFMPQSSSFYSFVENRWFWKTLFSYKGRDLQPQRGGFAIGLNHLQSENVISLSDAMNRFYGLNSSVRFRYSQNQQKPTLYIP